MINIINTLFKKRTLQEIENERFLKESNLRFAMFKECVKPLSERGVIARILFKIKYRKLLKDSSREFESSFSNLGIENEI